MAWVVFGLVWLYGVAYGVVFLCWGVRGLWQLFNRPIPVGAVERRERVAGSAAELTARERRLLADAIRARTEGLGLKPRR